MTKESLPTPVKQAQERLSETEEKTFDILVAEHRRQAINMDKFKGMSHYDERLERDKRSVEKKKAIIKEQGTEPTKRAQILEAIFAEQIELSDWFGQNTHTVVPSEYDDLFNGIDLALEVKDETRTDYLALGIDVTSSPRNIREKLKKTKEHIANGTLATMEYFHSEIRPDFYDILKNIPQVIVGVESRTIKELTELWMTAYGLPKLRLRSGVSPSLSKETVQSQRTAVKEAKNKLGQHRIQFLILEQIKIQLAVFRNFAIISNRSEAAQKFSYLLGLVDLVLQEKDVPKREDVFKNNEDLVFQALNDAVKDFENL